MCVLALAVTVNAVPNCGNYTCPPGFRPNTLNPPENIQCEPVCNAQQCCWVPTCISALGIWGACPINYTLRLDAAVVQCPQNDAVSCSLRTCCVRVPVCPGPAAVRLPNNILVR